MENEKVDIELFFIWILFAILILGFFCLFIYASYSFDKETRTTTCNQSCLELDMDFYRVIEGGFGSDECWCLDSELKPIEIPIR